VLSSLGVSQPSDVLVVATLLLLTFGLLIYSDVVGPYLFQKFRTEENVREILSQVYRNPAAVDDHLIKILCEPGQDEGAEQGE